MNPGTVIYRGKSRKGTPLLIRYPKASDAPLLLRHINTLARERTFISRQDRQISLREERVWLGKMIAQVRKNRTVMLLAFAGKELAGVSDLEQKSDALHPEGVFGIAVAKKFRGEGIGTLLMRLVLKEAKRIEGLKIVILNVFANNRLGKNIYKKFGFKEYGAIPGGILHRGRYVDDVYMYKKV